MNKTQSLGLNTIYSGPSSWWQHIPVAHFLVEKIQPEVIVELGSHYGVSLFGFCEAVDYFRLNTHIYGIDTWSGDSQAGFYGDDVYNLVLKHRDLHHNQRCELIRELFDEAKDFFEDKSIDVLHIDGLHTYDAVKNDYIKWMPKVKDGGTILFHDINVRRKDFGVWKLWEEIKEKEDYAYVEIKSGHGLGILNLRNERPEWHGELIENLAALRSKGLLLERINKKYEELNLIKENDMIKDKHISNLELMLKDKVGEVTGLLKELDRIQRELEQNKLEFERITHEKERGNSELEKTRDELEKTRDELQRTRDELEIFKKEELKSRKRKIKGFLRAVKYRLIIKRD